MLSLVLSFWSCCVKIVRSDEEILGQASLVVSPLREFTIVKALAVLK